MKRSKGLELLRELAYADSYEKHPTLPDYARTIHNYNDRNSNGLTRCILDYLRFNGHQCERIAVTGRYNDQSKVVSDITGAKRRIGSGQWIPSSMQPGTADISATIHGRSIKIEIKIGRDKQSDHQVKYQQEVEKAGGLYWLVRNFDEFLKFYNRLT